jgi:hypothetical protein
MLDATPHRVEVKARVAWVDSSGAMAEWARRRWASQPPARWRATRAILRLGLVDTVVAEAWPEDTSLVEWRNLGQRTLAVYSNYGASYPAGVPDPAAASRLGWLSAPDSIDILWGTVPKGTGSSLVAISQGESLTIKIEDWDKKVAVGTWILQARFFGKATPVGDRAFALRVKLSDQDTAKSWVEFPVVVERTGVRSLFLANPHRIVDVGFDISDGRPRDERLYASGWLAKPTRAIPEGDVACILTATADRQVAIDQHVDRYVEMPAIRLPVRVRFRKAIVKRVE